MDNTQLIGTVIHDIRDLRIKLVEQGMDLDSLNIKIGDKIVKVKYTVSSTE